MNKPTTTSYSESTPARTPSAEQPKTKTREEWHKLLAKYKAEGMEDIARQLDEQHKLGFFADIAAKQKQEEERKRLEQLPMSEKALMQFVTCDKDMMILKEHVRKLAPEQDTIVIYGESGTGKELLARGLHGTRTGNFVSVNCAGLPEHLIESELFGHTAGAFTGASKNKVGLMQAAANGTLFLDEIGELPLTLQAKLLRAIQERHIRKVGAETEEKISCRFVCATHRTISELVAQGKFRLDLFYRISTLELRTKPLRERIKDISLIVSQLDTNKVFPTTFDWAPYVLKTKLNGNVREVQSVIRRYQLLGILPNV